MPLRLAHLWRPPTMLLRLPRLTLARTTADDAKARRRRRWSVVALACSMAVAPLTGTTLRAQDAPAGAQPAPAQPAPSQPAPAQPAGGQPAAGQPATGQPTGQPAATP